MARIFVSYSDHDVGFTQRFVHDLRRAGADVWVDETAVTHATFEQLIDSTESINDAFERSEWVVLVLTPNAIAAAYVREEVLAALRRINQGHMRGIISVLAAPCLPGTIPTQWGWLPCYDATSDYGSALANVLVAVGLQPVSALVPSGESAADLIARGNAAMGQEYWFALGIPFYERATQVEPGNLDAWLTLAFAHFWAGPRREALAAYERALAIDPEHLHAWTNKGILLSKLGRHEEALAAYDRALAIRQNGLGWAQRARTLRALGRDAEAEEAERHEQEFPR